MLTTTTEFLFVSPDSAGAEPNGAPAVEESVLPDLPEEIQGNIVNAFARRHAAYLFIRFHDDDPLRVRADLKQLLTAFVTSKARQDDLFARYKAGGRELIVDGAGMFGLSASGYARLRLPRSLPPDPSGDPRPFYEGMKHWQDYVWNIRKSSWEEPYLSNDVDAFLLLADDDRNRLDDSVREAKAKLDSIGRIVAEENGHRLMRERREYEHYGFLEGISTAADPGRVLVPESALAGDGSGYGCFASFLKLEQNVCRFHKESRELAERARENGSEVTAREIRERCIGRNHSGAPLLPQPPGDPEKFTFDRVAPEVCPYHAHVRAMRPAPDEPRGAFLRRGISYGAKRPDIDAAELSADAPETGSGLLFLSLQNTLWTFIALMGRAQRRVDPTLARVDDLHGRRGQEWSFHGLDNPVVYPMTDFTTVRGGEYFFIPSMKFIRNLA
jgi:Dyp-type peroxidase family